MGNTPSNQNGSADASGNASPSGTGAGAGGANASSSSNLGAPSSSTPQPIAGTTVRSGTAPVFHSGLTPPARTPSPPPPSTPPLLPYAGHLSPQNPHALSLPQSHDYSKSVVTGLIMEAKLAPFYRGLEDFEEDWTEEDIAKVLNEVREQDLEADVSNSVTERLKEEREAAGASGIGSVTKKMIHRNKDARREEEHQEREKRERRAYIAAVECPICFLNYPSNINTSRCCQQPICTECFVQIKRGEATITHLESEPAACPFCVETEFGVIYERPSTASTPSLPSTSALAISPDNAGASGFSQALSTHSEDVELSVGPGMAPKAQEKLRRKSVSSKAAEVVTIDQIRPDWERKLNAVKAAAARRASRRIVMRQVGDRLVPIGFTSARAPGTADFSMSTGGAGGNAGDESGSRRSRRGTRERDLEELMIMEAMRLSMIDHEDHQKKMNDQVKSGGGGGGGGSGTATPNSTATGEASSSRVMLSGPLAGTSSSASPGGGKEKEKGTASKFLSSIRNKNRARSDSAASTKSNKSVSFSAGTSGGGAGAGIGPSASRTSGSSSPTSTSPVVTARSPPTTSNLKPAAPAAAAPVTTLTDHRDVTAGADASGDGNAPVGSIPRISMEMPPRISMDMPPMEPTPAKSMSTHAHVEQQQQQPGAGDDGAGGDGIPVPPTYARLNSEA